MNSLVRDSDSSERIQTLNSSQFNALVLEGEGPIAVEFMSYGCGHCQALEPVLQQVAEKVKTKEKIYRVNVATQQELAGDYEIEGTPTILMFLNGQEVGRVEGPYPTVSSVMTAVTQPFQL
jgi:thioredoxin 1